MSQRLTPRLRAPLLTGVVGLGLAIVVAVGAGWTAAAPVAAISIVAALVYYWLGGTSTDVGALLARRADERQATVRLWVRAFAGVVMLTGGLVGAIVASMLGQPAWPYALIVGVGTVTLAGGLLLGRTSSDLTAGATRGALARLDERRAALLIDAFQRAGVVMFLSAVVGSLALIGRPADDAFRYLAVGFGGAVAIGFAIFWPRRANHP